MGSESVFGKGAGKDKIERAVWGLVIALLIFMILNTINPDLTKLNLTLDQIEKIATPTGTGAGTDTGGVCSIQPLTAPPDEISTRMERGERVIWENTNPRLKCAAEKFVSLSGGNAYITSAYRPQTYQTHLWEIKDRWCDKRLESNTNPLCQKLRTDMLLEISTHFGRGWNCGAVAYNNSTHGAGIGVDISGGDPSKAKDACLIFRNYPGDPYHYDIDLSCTKVCK